MSLLKRGIAKEKEIRDHFQRVNGILDRREIRRLKKSSLFFRLFGNGGLSFRADLEERGRGLRAGINATYTALGEKTRREIMKDYV